jgi:hypothetical protein
MVDGSAPNPGDHGGPVEVGTVIAGRYRLLERLGSAARGRLDFWYGSDAVLARDIGLTLVVDSEQADFADWAGWCGADDPALESVQYSRMCSPA